MTSRPADRPETPPNRSIVIPFSRDVDFVERAILEQIYQKYAVSGYRTALVGLGGVGKSQLAIEYAYRTRDRSPETWIFWVHASNATELLVALEFMPLAIVQAAAYILRRKSRYSVREYLQSFRESDYKRTSLLDYNGKQLRRDKEAKNSIIIIWQLSFNHIRNVS